MKKSGINYVITIVGAVILFLGLYLTKTLVNPQGFMLAFPYVCVGIGCGVFGHGMGNVISNKVINSNPVAKKQYEIDVNDERNITISNISKAKAYDMMTFVFGALMVSYALMGADIVVILLLVSSYLFVHGYGIYCRYKYDKKM